MKKIIFIAISCTFLLSATFAQDETDALRYSQFFLGGTARSVAMGGAFGALGGDFTSLSLNPAGIGVYRSTELSFTPILSVNNTNTNYMGNAREDESIKLNLNSLGFISSKQTGNETGLLSVNF